MGLRVGLTTNHRHQEWIRSIGDGAQALAAVSSLGALYLAWTIMAGPAKLIEYAVFGLAGISVVAGFAAYRVHAALADRLDLLSLALDTVPDAQVIVAGDGRMAYANPAFDRLFPGRGELPLECIQRSIAADPESVTEFLQLRSQAATG